MGLAGDRLKWFVFLAVLATLAKPVHAEPRRIWTECEIGTAAPLGYNLPYWNCGARVEQPIGRRFEAQFRSTFSPTSKALTGDGKTFDARGTALVWLAPDRFGLTMNVGKSWLWTSQFNKSEWLYAPGVMTSFWWNGGQQRIGIDWLLPSGGFDASTGIESSRLTGPEITWEAPLYRRVSLVTRFAAYRALEQGNQACDGSLGGPVTCKRLVAIAGTYTIGIAVNIGRVR